LLTRPFLETRAAASPEAPALECEGTRLSYRELDARAALAARNLREAGVRERDAVAALLPSGTAFVVLLHAVARLGAALLPLHLRLAPRELLHPLRDAGARWLVHGAGELAARAAGAAAGLPGLATLPASALEGSAAEAERARAAHAAREPHDFDPAQPLAVVYTSGTSGAPKGAELSHANFFASALASAFHLGVLPGDRWLACLPLYHVGGLSIPLRSAITGTTALVHERFDADAVSRALDEDGVTGISLVATMLARLLEVRGERPPPRSLRFALLGGSGAPRALLARARSAGWPLLPSYGLTEACSQVATRRPGDRESPEGAGLAPLVGTRVRIAGEDGRALGPDAPGEILVRGPTVTRGYRGRPAETAALLRGGWLHTGDVGVLDARGLLRVLDRRSDLIVSGGENVYPAEIEAVLLEHPGVAEAGVAARPDALYGQRPAAWIVPHNAAWPPTPAELDAFCRARLAAFKVPVSFESRAALPRNATGKLLRRELAAHDDTVTPEA
jgi:O-succinylbenzoic acid--CoA ligase